MHCEKCGATFDSEEKTCPECGEDIEKMNEEKELPVTEEKETEQPENNDNQEPETKAKPGKKKKILISVLAVLLVVAIVGGTVLGNYLNQPLVKIERAFNKTLFSSSSIDVNVTVDKFIADNEISASLDFGKGIKGSVFEGSYKSRVGESKVSIKEGIVYVNGVKKTSVDEFVREANKNGGEKEKLAVKLLEALDKSIYGKLDKKALKEFIENELIPYYAGSSGTDVPSYDETRKAFKEVIKECMKRGAIVITESKEDKTEVFTFDIDTKAVINCIFELSEENETVAAYVTMLVDMVSDLSGGFISSKKDIEMLLPSFIGSELDFSITVESGRIIGIKPTEDTTILIKSEK